MPINIKTLVYPGFPTDLQQPIVALLSVCKGYSIVEETIYENRFNNVEYLNKLGAKITINKTKLKIEGVSKLKGNVIEVSRDNFDVGKNSWRKIMYLCKVHNFQYMITNFAGKSKRNKSDNEENNIKFKNNKVNINASIIL